MKTLNNFLVKDKDVLLRVDLNIPISKDGKVTNDKKLMDIKSTVDKLRTNNNKIFLLSHFGRPKGQVNKKYSIEFLKETLLNILSVNTIYFASTCKSDQINKQKKQMKPGDICLLENIRFYQGEEINDINFARNLANNFNIYVNDAFSVSHRNHASIVAITSFLPAVAGINLLSEIKNLNNFLSNPKKPSTVIIGGSKISTKLKLLSNLIEIFSDSRLLQDLRKKQFVFF